MAGRIGIIGGSGLYDIEGVEDLREVPVDTPFGPPSDPPLLGRLGAQEVVFLARHGRGHRYTPSELPYRANLYALKSLGVQWVISVSAVGSLRDDVHPGDVVLVDQFIDRTRFRPSTFFGDGVVAHVSFGDPVCETLRQVLVGACRDVGATAHDRGTYVVMEGPAFSTRAESELYRSWGASVIGMTNLPEAKLAREAEMSYATLALVTDYDCWHLEHDQVSVESVIEQLLRNVALAREVIRVAIPRIEGTSPYEGALKNAIMTAPEHIPPARREALDLLVGKYLP